MSEAFRAGTSPVMTGRHVRATSSGPAPWCVRAVILYALLVACTPVIAAPPPAGILLRQLPRDPAERIGAVSPEIFANIIVLLAAAAALLVVTHHAKKKRAKEMERVRIQIATDLHDDVGSALTRIAVQSEVIAASGDPAKVRAAARLVGEECREIISTMADVVWSIDARNDTVGDLLGRMRDFAAGVLGPIDARMHFSESGLEPGRVLPVHVRQNLYLIFKEAVSNIARHSATSDVWIDLLNDSAGFLLVIRDNGHESTRYTHLHGQGQRNMRMRAERLGARLDILNDHGLEVILRMARL